jgi:hypothetical protein
MYVIGNLYFLQKVTETIETKGTHSFGRLDEELGLAKLILRLIDVYASQYPFHTLFLVTGPARPRFFRENRVSV